MNWWGTNLHWERRLPRLSSRSRSIGCLKLFAQFCVHLVLCVLLGGEVVRICYADLVALSVQLLEEVCSMGRDPKLMCQKPQPRAEPAATSLRSSLNNEAQSSESEEEEDEMTSVATSKQDGTRPSMEQWVWAVGATVVWILYGTACLGHWLCQDEAWICDVLSFAERVHNKKRRPFLWWTMSSMW